MTREEILQAIRDAAAQNGGQPLGTARFEAATGITRYEWERYWPRFSDAQAEAGFARNTLTGPYPDEFLIERLLGIIRERQRVPTVRELRIVRRSDPSFPHPTVFDRFGTKNARIGRALRVTLGTRRFAPDPASRVR